MKQVGTCNTGYSRAYLYAYLPRLSWTMDLSFIIHELGICLQNGTKVGILCILCLYKYKYYIIILYIIYIHEHVISKIMTQGSSSLGPMCHHYHGPLPPPQKVFRATRLRTSALPSSYSCTVYQAMMIAFTCHNLKKHVVIKGLIHII